MKKSSRRRFLGQAGLVVSAAVLASRFSARAETNTALPTETGAPPKKSGKNRKVFTALTPTGWNLYATRFVSAPTWEWQPFKGAVAYVVMFAGENEARAQTVRVEGPRYDMTKAWPALPFGSVDIIAWPVDARDRPLAAEWRKKFYKAPPFDGIAQQPLDWAASIHRSMEYLLAPARDEVEEFEKGLPRSAWASSENSITGERRLLAFPALHYPSFIFTYLLYAQQYPDGKLTPEALRQAKQYAEWLLTNRQPADWRCSLFPYSTIEDGKLQGYIEGQNITLFRAARVGEAMVALHRQFNDDRYLAYARHLANVFVELQQPDGSWPFRVNPKDGSVVEAYTSAAIPPARLMGLLEQIEPNPDYAACRQKAARWVLENPVRTRRWQGMYEDVGAQAPYRNLEHWDTNATISYLIHYRSQIPAAVKTAEELNAYIEDQFVAWQPSDHSFFARSFTPMVAEQYTCYYPMEVHTAIWVQSLLTLHHATGKKNYLTKAINAANAIVRSQQATGAYSTWGFDPRFGRPLMAYDWPGCNAEAVQGLIKLARYCGSPSSARGEEQAL